MDHATSTKLFNHVRALEALDEQKAEVQDDIKQRTELLKADGFDPAVTKAILKRRKAGAGQTRAFDELVEEYEEALREKGLFDGSATEIKATVHFGSDATVN